MGVKTTELKARREALELAVTLGVLAWACAAPQPSQKTRQQSLAPSSPAAALTSRSGLLQSGQIRKMLAGLARMRRWRAIEAGVVTPGGNASTLDAPPILFETLAPLVHLEAAAHVAFDRTPPMERAAGLACKDLHGIVEETLARGEVPLILGGECSLIAGSLSAASNRISSLSLAFFDAHADFNTVQTTPSGYLGGMCLAHVCGLFVDPLPWSAASPFPGKNVFLIGGRSLDPGEMENLDRMGVRRIAPEASDAVLRIRESMRDKPVWVHVDLDVVDPTSMFAVSHPTPNGIAFERLSELLSAAAKAGRVQGIEICGYLPGKDRQRVLPNQIATAVAGMLSQGVD